MRPGFLGTGAPLRADVNLMAQLAMGAALLFGARLARQKRFAAHGACQTAVLLLNLPAIALAMWPSFSGLVLPRLGTHFGRRFYAVAAAHGALGALAEILGLYIVAVAKTDLVPRALRFRSWKAWMRAELALWWAAILMGVGTYVVWYGVPRGG